MSHECNLLREFLIGQEIPFSSCPTPQSCEYFKIFSNMLHLMTDSIYANEVDEIVDLSKHMNNDSDAEIDNEAPDKCVTSSNVLLCLNTVKTFLMQRDVDDAVFSSFHEVEK
ncbi:hypothetical protein TNCV_2304101 [Trichonephila clavipes]|nr:hypothetical protein TNCV_2304101 [Trichonephila clavipes]